MPAVCLPAVSAPAITAAAVMTGLSLAYAHTFDDQSDGGRSRTTRFPTTGRPGRRRGGDDYGVWPSHRGHDVSVDIVGYSGSSAASDVYGHFLGNRYDRDDHFYYHGERAVSQHAGVACGSGSDVGADDAQLFAQRHAGNSEPNRQRHTGNCISTGNSAGWVFWQRSGNNCRLTGRGDSAAVTRHADSRDRCHAYSDCPCRNSGGVIYSHADRDVRQPHAYRFGGRQCDCSTAAGSTRLLACRHACVAQPDRGYGRATGTAHGNCTQRV